RQNVPRNVGQAAGSQKFRRCKQMINLKVVENERGQGDSKLKSDENGDNASEQIVHRGPLLRGIACPGTPDEIENESAGCEYADRQHDSNLNSMKPSHNAHSNVEGKKRAAARDETGSEIIPECFGI